MTLTISTVMLLTSRQLCFIVAFMFQSDTAVSHYKLIKHHHELQISLKSQVFIKQKIAGVMINHFLLFSYVSTTVFVETLTDVSEHSWSCLNHQHVLSQTSCYWALLYYHWCCRCRYCHCIHCWHNDAVKLHIRFKIALLSSTYKSSLQQYAELLWTCWKIQ